jgi:uncharacterized membrane protein YfcA
MGFIGMAIAISLLEGNPDIRPAYIWGVGHVCGFFSGAFMLGWLEEYF